MACETFIQPLNLHCILVNIFAGKIEIFAAIAIIIISALCAKFRMPNGIFLLMMVIFSIFMVRYLPWLFVLVAFVLSIIIFFPIKNIFIR